MTKNKKEEKASVADEQASKVVEEQEAENADTEEKGQEELKAQENEVDRLTSELEESKDKYLRLYSEFDNFRRRTAKEKLDPLSS